MAEMDKPQMKYWVVQRKRYSGNYIYYRVERMKPTEKPEWKDTYTFKIGPNTYLVDKPTGIKRLIDREELAKPGEGTFQYPKDGSWRYKDESD